jgi:hypothetical protein
MKNAYQRRRVKARVEKRARMMKLDAITLEFARRVIEEETGTPLEIGSAPAPSAAAGQAPTAPVEEPAARLIARDDKKNPLISTYEWTDDAAQRILRVPAGFMRNKTQERIEALAAERTAARRADASGAGGPAIDLALVEEGIELGKKMMAEMIANYPTPGAGGGAAKAAHAAAGVSAVPAADGRGYLNEVSPLTQRDS